MADERASLPQARCGAFEGPLDLLLEEVRRQRVAVEDVAMAPLVAGFLAYVRAGSGRSLDPDIEWLQMAATLIHWKSLSLLPREASGPAPEAIRDALVRQLLAHRKAVSEELERRRTEASNSFTRGPADPREAAAEALTVWDLLRQSRELAAWVRTRRAEASPEAPGLEMEREEVPVEEMCAYLRRRLLGLDRVEGTSLLREAAPAPRRLALFLGMLEMVRNGELAMEQEMAFGEFWLIVGSGPSV